MARSITEIKKEMTQAFVSNPEIRRMYGISGDGGFDELFSKVSVENLLFFIVATVVHLLETMFDSLKDEVDEKSRTAVVASLPWYYSISMEYQHGDELVYDDTTKTYRYAVEDDTKRIVKFAACRDRGGGVLILVSGQDGNGKPAALDSDILQVFKEYIRQRKPAGVLVDVFSYDPDSVRLSLSVQYDPLILDSGGKRINGTDYPVETAINQYLSNIKYGGTFNKTKLVDAVQEADGVIDVALNQVTAKSANETYYTVVSGNNYVAVGGAFKAENLKEDIGYVLQL